LLYSVGRGKEERAAARIIEVSRGSLDCATLSADIANAADADVGAEPELVDLISTIIAPVCTFVI
jgi:hypothetical protein